MMHEGGGWENYYCHKCGALAGHFHVGLGWTKPFWRVLKKISTFRSVCPEHRKVRK